MRKKRSRNVDRSLVYKIRVDQEVDLSLKALAQELRCSEAQMLAFALNLGTAAVIKVASEQRQKQLDKELADVDSSETKETN